MARIVVCGYMIRHPMAGNVMAYLQYVLGLARLGHDVVYLEESGWPRACYDPAAGDMVDDPAFGMGVVEELLQRYGADVPVLYVNRDTREVAGGVWEDVVEQLHAADLLINVGGVSWLPEFMACGRRAYIDMDPLFTQLGRFGAEALDQHDVHFSYGANIGQPSCSVPDTGIRWHPTVPPVVTDVWQHPLPSEPVASIADQNGALTTIANWTAYGGLTHEGTRYGQKDEEFLRVIDLPGRTPQSLELTLSGAGDDIERRFRRAGWQVRPAEQVSHAFDTYHAYVTGSHGEFSVAKHAYVVTRSGWFSDRSVSYLAAGRPVVLQDTGFTDWLPSGEGVLAFNTVGEAAAAIDRLNRAYDEHREAALRTARDHFGHDVVLPRLLDRALDGKRRAR